MTNPIGAPLAALATLLLEVMDQLLLSAAVAERSPAQRSGAETALHPASTF
jgi:hypothetical protein